jgi:hypothetical protein
MMGRYESGHDTDSPRWMSWISSCGDWAQVASPLMARRRHQDMDIERVLVEAENHLWG